MKKANKGITLVALIVTIVILLILAGIAISQLTGNGLFEKAKQAKEKQENAQIEEDLILADYENKTGEYVNGSREQITVDKEEYEQLKKDVASLKSQIRNEDYSTTEKVIGTWTNGKPVYRKVWENLDTSYTLTSNTWLRINEINIPNIERLIKADFCTHQTNGEFKHSLSFATDTSDYIQVQNIRSTNFSIGKNAGFTYSFILEYTKTTDSTTNN